ncbi:uncharacterized protein LOC118917952 isoform X2 [Manis pentadactyla]|uniref:uncharacterized protein LOC118917952 isoform X2 n=1 Tax=Manis pentadactyla TaxID=143292 RepID=UPI00255CE5C1|nr:uncharacterized protein LOC118917952 isoform X2 [Manis pentadactyla]
MPTLCLGMPWATRCHRPPRLTLTVVTGLCSWEVVSPATCPQRAAVRTQVPRRSPGGRGSTDATGPFRPARAPWPHLPPCLSRHPDALQPAEGFPGPQGSVRIHMTIPTSQMRRQMLHNSQLLLGIKTRRRGLRVALQFSMLRPEPLPSSLSISREGGGLRGVGPRDPAMCQQAPPSRRTWRTWAPALGRASCRLQQPCGESLGVNQMFHGLARARLPSFRGPTSCRFCGNAGDCPRVTQAWG